MPFTLFLSSIIQEEGDEKSGSDEDKSDESEDDKDEGKEKDNNNDNNSDKDCSSDDDDDDENDKGEEDDKGDEASSEMSSNIDAPVSNNTSRGLHVVESQDDLTDENGNLKLVIKTNGLKDGTATSVLRSPQPVSSDVKVMLRKFDVQEDQQLPDDGVGGNPDDNDDVGGVIKIMPLRRSLLPTRKLRPRIRIKAPTPPHAVSNFLLTKIFFLYLSVLINFSSKGS